MSQQSDLDRSDLDFLQSYYLVQLEATGTGGPFALHISRLGAHLFADHPYDHHRLSGRFLLLRIILCLHREQ